MIIKVLSISKNSENFLMFIFERAWVREGQREWETQNLRQAPGSVNTEPDVGFEPTNCEMTWAEGGRLTDWATQVPL